MTDILYDTTPAAVIAALEANWRDYRRSWGRLSTVAIRDDARFFWFMTGMADDWVNAILRVNVTPTSVDGAIDEAVAAFARRGVPWLWIVGPTSAPADLPTQLAARGFHLVGHCPGMSWELPAAEIALTLPHGLEIRPVTDAATMDQWLHAWVNDDDADAESIAYKQAIQRASVGFAGKHDYLGLLDGVPVATATLLLSSGVAGIYAVNTLPTARRQGIGAAMTLMALREAQRQGYRIATLQASSLGLPIYQRLGFTVCHRFAIYAPPDAK